MTYKTRRDRRRAALMYAGAMLYNDDGETKDLFGNDLRDIADNLLRRAGFDQSQHRWPTMEQIKAAARGER